MSNENRKAYLAEYRAKNREAILAKGKELYWANRESRLARAASPEYKEYRRKRHAERMKNPEQRAKILLQMKRYRENNLELCNNADREWRKNNRARYRATKKAWVAKNKQKDSESHSRSYFKNREKRLATRKQFYLKNPDRKQANYAKRKLLIRAAGVNLKGIKAFILKIKSKEFVRCYYCEKSTSSKGCNFDHIVALSRGGNHSIENLCATCPDCNRKKYNKSISEWERIGQQILSL